MSATTWIPAALCGALCAACSTSNFIDMDSEIEPSEGIAVVGGCIATITYAGGDGGVAVDELIYDARLQLLEQKRRYADGLETQRTWEWSDTGMTAERQWFDGTREVAFDELGRLSTITTYESTGHPIFSDTVRYGELGLLAARQVEHFENGEPVSMKATIYEYEDGSPTAAITSNPSDPEDLATVVYDYAALGDDILLKASHDSEGDGVIDLTTSVTIAADGLVKEGTDKNGQAVTYEYEGPRCAEVASSWPFGDPFYFDL